LIVAPAYRDRLRVYRYTASPDLAGRPDQVVIRGLRVDDTSCDLLLHRWRGPTSAEVLRKDALVDVVARR